MPYTAEKTRNAEKRIAEAWTGPCFHTPVEVTIMFDREGIAVTVTPVDVEQLSKLRGDLDNYLKTVLDALNGIAWDDDRQVVKITAVKL